MDFKYCPFCSSKNITLPNNRYMKCYDCQRTYYHNAAAAVAGIIMCGDEVLLNIRKKAPKAGFFDLVGGFVDFEESLETALQRETQEELGITIKDWQHIGSDSNTYQYDSVIYHTVDSVFVSHLKAKPKMTIQQTELEAAVWVNRNDIPYDKFAFDSLKHALKRYLSSAN